MAFLSKVGNLLRQAVVSKPVSSELSSVSRPFPAIFQAIRCLSSAVSSKLFVGGLSYGTDDQSLREAFSRYGEVIEAKVIMDRETGRSRGFGFVTFTSSEGASSAMQELDGQDLHGRRVRVNFANERPRPRSNFGYGPPGGYADGYGAGQGGYGPGPVEYGAGQGGYGSNQMGYGAGQGGYGSNQLGYGAGQGGYGSGEAGYSAGQGGYGSGQPGYGAGQGGYTSHQAGYGAGGASYGSARPNYDGGNISGDGGNIGNFGSGGSVGVGQGSAETNSTSFSADTEIADADLISDTGANSFSTVGNEDSTDVGFDDNTQFASNLNSNEDNIGGFDQDNVLEVDDEKDNQGEDYAKRA